MQRRRDHDIDRLRRAAVPALAVLLLVALLVPAALQGPEAAPLGHSLRGDATRSGRVAVDAPRAPREVAWEAAGPETALGVASLRPASGAAMFGQDELLEVLDLATGALVRRVDVATEATHALARVVGDVLLLPDTADPVLVAQDLATGGELWRLPTGSFAREAAAQVVAVGEHDLVVPAPPTRISRVTRRSGETAWSTDLAVAERLGVVRLLSADEAAIVLLAVDPPGAGIDAGGSAQPWLVGLDASTGTVTWRVPLDSRVAVAPLAAGPQLVAHLDVTRGPDVVVVVRDARTGAEQSSLPVTGDGFDLAVLGDLVLVSSDLGVQGWTARGTSEAFFTELDTVAAPLRTSADAGRVVVAVADGLRVLDQAGNVVGTIAMSPGPGAQDPPGRWELVDGVVVLAREDLEAAAFDLAGNPLWSRALAAPPLAGLASDGEVVAVHGPAGLVVLDGRNGDRLTSVESIDEDGRRLPVPGSVAIDDAVVVTSPFGGGSSGRGLSAVRARTGIGAWSRDGDAPPAFGTITRTPGRVWVAIDDEVHGYESATGRRTWATLAGIPRGPLAVTAELVVATPVDARCVGREACDQAVAAHDVEARSLAWVSPAPACGPPAIADGRVLVPTAEGPWALGVSDGGLLWSAPFEPGAGCAPLAVDADVVVQGSRTRVLAWGAADGEPSWQVEFGSPLTTDPVLAGDEVVVATADGQLVALASASGEVRWQLRLPAPALADPVVVDGRWVVLLRDGRVVGLR